MATYYSKGNEVIVSIKGATESIIMRSNRININGQILTLDNHIKSKLSEVTDTYAKNSLRTIAIGYNIVSGADGHKLNDENIQ